MHAILGDVGQRPEPSSREENMLLEWKPEDARVAVDNIYAISRLNIGLRTSCSFTLRCGNIEISSAFPRHNHH
ncbi:hypothetical protein E2C01_078287 [Portunus trituberculatus]|uniref:Uncharacterized protein n=1 Tax=Portunus trituberculatus TaxID=210409 RepID=A0A5B7IMJ4_PORTR|nr:hypothetical protein [Portunus trituberculatus]